jgi:hypothetical protein
MKFKPKEILVNLPAVHMFNDEEKVAEFAANINTIIHGKVKIKYEVLGFLGGQMAALFYVQRNHESQQLRDEFTQLIENEESILSESPFGPLASAVGYQENFGEPGHPTNCDCKICRLLWSI